ncbi:PAAR domain-containing protein [Psychrobacter sp. S1-30-MNA-CIBAN-0213]|uniref:PAAR domain-containing protein n=1 Tax=Psychrobacter sp. S1-30-MNA-CIBAN-0213 TaxID=3140456 RepID=UPI0033184A97
MAAYITVGAKTSHGGTVISGSPHTTHNGIPVSRKGDKVICKKCKKVTTILSGDPSFIVDGAPIARGGDVTSCGAKLIAIQQSFCESDFEVFGVEQPTPLVFAKSDPDSMFASFAASDNKDSEDEMSDEELGIWVDVSTEQALKDSGLWAGAGTPEELIYQERLNSLWIDVNGDRAKYHEGVQKIGDEAGLVFDIMSFPLGWGALSAKTSVKAGQYVIRKRAVSNNNIYRDSEKGFDWTSTKKRAPNTNLAEHWSKHSKEFPELKSQNDYYRHAQEFVSDPPRGTLNKTRKNGDTVLYNPKTNTFAVKTKDGAPRTIFKPDASTHPYSTNLEYFHAQ